MPRTTERRAMPNERPAWAKKAVVVLEVPGVLMRTTVPVPAAADVRAGTQIS